MTASLQKTVLLGLEVEGVASATVFPHRRNSQF
jgi:hypothetical protein